MLSTARADTAPTRRFTVWLIGMWIVLLFAAMGAVQYLQHAEYAYLLAALLIFVVCAGCILRLAWARPTMQVLAALLALWALVSGVLMLQQWGDFETARQHALAMPPQLGDIALWTIARAQRTWQVGLVLKALAMPLLLWLAWQLGRPAVRMQFKRRR
jgi:hypothetical protein